MDGTSRRRSGSSVISGNQDQPCSRFCNAGSDYNFGGHLARSAYFTVDTVNAPGKVCCDEESFTSVLVLEGSGSLRCGGEEVACRKGDSLFVPADSGWCELTGDLQTLCTLVGTI